MVFYIPAIYPDLSGGAWGGFRDRDKNKKTINNQSKDNTV